MPRPSVREQIVEAAVQQLHRMGFNGCSVEDITTAAGVPKGSFYNHFKSKEDLALEVIGVYADAGPHEILAKADVPPLKRLKQYFAALAETFVASGYTRGCLLGNFAGELSDHSAAVQARLKAVFTEWVGLLAHPIEEAQRDGEIESKAKPEQLAGVLLSAWQGTLLRTRATRDPGLVKEFTSVAFGHILK
jgi:TetR/AcrR family transcriptional repressor of nem operon